MTRTANRTITAYLSHLYSIITLLLYHHSSIMIEDAKVKTLDKVVIRFSGDSGDGMQLVGNIFTNVSAGLGNQEIGRAHV